MLEFLFTLSFGSIVAWAVIFYVCCLLVDIDFSIGTAIIIIGLIGASLYHYQINILNYLEYIIYGIITYIVIGVGWSFFKLSRKLKERLKENYAGKPVLEDYIRDICYWIAFWPFSFISYIFKLLFCDFIEWVASLFKRQYQKIIDIYYPEK